MIISLEITFAFKQFPERTCVWIAKKCKFRGARTGTTGLRLPVLCSSALRAPLPVERVEGANTELKFPERHLKGSVWGRVWPLVFLFMMKWKVQLGSLCLLCNAKRCERENDDSEVVLWWNRTVISAPPAPQTYVNELTSGKPKYLKKRECSFSVLSVEKHFKSGTSELKLVKPASSTWVSKRSHFRGAHLLPLVRTC